MKKGNFQLFAMQIPEISEPDLYINFFALASASRRATTSTPAATAMRYRNPEIDRLIDRGAAQLDRERAQSASTREIQKILARDVPVISLWHEDNIAAMRKNVDGFEHAADGAALRSRPRLQTSRRARRRASRRERAGRLGAGRDGVMRRTSGMPTKRRPMPSASSAHHLGAEFPLVVGRFGVVRRSMSCTVAAVTRTTVRAPMSSGACVTTYMPSPEMSRAWPIAIAELHHDRDRRADLLARGPRGAAAIGVLHEEALELVEPGRSTSPSG